MLAQAFLLACGAVFLGLLLRHYDAYLGADCQTTFAVALQALIVCLATIWFCLASIFLGDLVNN
jgi:hypothetical protein